MLTVDYSFYSDIYRGTAISPEEWPKYSRNAAAYLNAVTFGRAADSLPFALSESCRMALCAVAEVDFYQDAGGEVASASNDGYSETYVTSQKTPEQRRYAAVSGYLSMTGLLYQGGGAPCCYVTKP